MDVASLKIERRPTRPAGRRRRGPRLGLIALAVLIGLGWLFRGPLMELVDRYRLPTVQVLRVVESHPAAAGVVSGTAANGHIIASRRAALSADTPGRIVELNVTEGSIVRKGDVVARLYPDEYAAALRRAEADVLSAKAQVDSAQSTVEALTSDLTQRQRSLDAAIASVAEAEANQQLARENFDRIRDLVERNIRSQADLDTVKAELDGSAARSNSAQAQQRVAASAVDGARLRIVTANADLAVAQARVQGLEASRQQAEATLAKTVVRAPFDGIVVLKDAEVGEVVSPNSQGGSNARGSVCTMVDLASLEAQAEVPETNLASVVQGAPATVFLDAWPERPYQGRVDRIWPTANRQKATIEVRIAFLEPDDRLRPEMGVRVVFGESREGAEATKAPDEQPAILLPQGAVVEGPQGSGVFVIERDSVRLQSIELGDRRGGRVAIRAGLTPGQRIVLDPPPSLRDGDRVQVQENS